MAKTHKAIKTQDHQAKKQAVKRLKDTIKRVKAIDYTLDDLDLEVPGYVPEIEDPCLGIDLHMWNVRSVAEYGVRVW